MTVETITPQIFYGIAVLCIVCWAAVVVLLISRITKKKLWRELKSFLTQNAVLLAFILALFSTLASLWLYPLAGIEPCELCWYQRIFMYPMVVVFGVGLWKKVPVKMTGMILTMVGMAIAMYHYMIQRMAFMAGTANCGGSVSCSQMYYGYFGFFSVPLMALTAFALIGVVLFFAKK